MARGRSTPSLKRGVLLGLVSALILGGVVLAVLGWRMSVVGPDCAGLTPEECALEREIALAVGQRQTLFGAAMAVLGVSVALFVRLGARDDGGSDEDRETTA